MGISRSVMLKQDLKHLDGEESVIELDMDNDEEIDEYPSDIFTEHDVLWSENDEERWENGELYTSMPSQYSLDSYLQH